MPARRIALATCARLPELPHDEQLLVAALARRGAEARPAVWDDPAVAWADFDAVVVRSTWDYHHRLAEFLGWVGALESARAPLWNPPALLRWNADKRYLRELAGRGIAVVPTRWVAAGAGVPLGAVMDDAGWSDVVVKPAVSATAWQTWRVPRAEAAGHEARFGALSATVDLMVQPCLAAVEREGEWSLCFTGGAFSHAILKRPAAGDFRVQVEFGGSATPRDAPSWLVEAARGVLAAAPGRWLYARVDGCVVAGAFVLLELELLEPSLFLDRDPAAADRFAAAILAACEGNDG